ncbi:MAG: VIT1/CCC1 family protein [Candidatus Aenigmatarchaeota archaeon]
MAKVPDGRTMRMLLKAQKNEITEHLIYAKLAGSVKDAKNIKILKNISDDELRHYNLWKKYTNRDAKPDILKVWKYFLISIIFGITFGIKLMENGERRAQKSYEKLSGVPEAKRILKDEDRHEKLLIGMIDEERLRYASAIVLGLNDALVELTGALAGFTLAFQNARLIAMAGLITGIAAAMSMAAAEYLSVRAEGRKDFIKASSYTGAAYILTVLFLISPYLLLNDLYLSLGITILNAIIVIFFFTFYISVAKGFSFRKRFFEMALISLGITAITFGIGFLIKML